MSSTYTQATNDGPASRGNPSCPGNKSVQTCVLRPAVVKYPVKLQNVASAHTTNGLSVGVNEAAYLGQLTGATDGIYIHDLKQLNGYEVLRYENVEEFHLSGGPPQSRIAGLQVALTSYLEGKASTIWDANAGFSVTQSGAAPQFLNHQPNGAFACDFAYSDPLSPDNQWGVPSVLQRINEITFALATDISRQDPANNLGHVKNYTGVMHSESIHYVSDYRYMYGAIASTLTCVLLTMPIYWGFWELGRKVTLGPLEIAHAFRSPMTAQSTHANLDDLIKEVGQQHIKYGHIVNGNARGVLGVAEPEYVEEISPGVGRSHSGLGDILGARRTRAS